MEEHRRSKRVPIKMELEVSSLFKQDNVKVEKLHAPIEVQDVSRAGIGFKTASILPIGYYFNARLEFPGEDENLNCVVKIIRHSTTEDALNFYGCEFVGLASIFDYVFEDIEKKYGGY